MIRIFTLIVISFVLAAAPLGAQHSPGRTSDPYASTVNQSSTHSTFHSPRAGFLRERLMDRSSFGREDDILFFENFSSGQIPPAGWLASQQGATAMNWSLGTVNPYSEPYFARHQWHTSLTHDNWLITPSIHLPAEFNQGYVVEFFERNASMNFYTYSGVWISAGSANPADGDFVELYESDQARSDWSFRSLDLSAFAGQQVYIAFRYQGINGHEWHIDEVGVKAFPVVNNFLYLEDFGGSFPPFAWQQVAMQEDPLWVPDTQAPFYSSANAKHTYGDEGQDVASWLLTPRILLPESSKLNFQLAFHERNSWMNFYGNSSVSRIELNGTQMEVGVGTNVTSFIPIYESNQPLVQWTQKRIDLDPWQGSSFNLAFIYEGEYAHEWFIDNVRIDAVANTIPWQENFADAFDFTGWLNWGWQAGNHGTDWLYPDDPIHTLYSWQYQSDLISPVFLLPNDNQNYILSVSLAGSALPETDFVGNYFAEIWAIDQNMEEYLLKEIGPLSHSDFREYWVSLNQFKGSAINLAVVNTTSGEENTWLLYLSDFSVKSVHDNDMMVESLMVPQRAVTGKNFLPRATFKNNGYLEQSPQVSFEIRQNGDIVYQNTTTLPGLAKGQVVDIFFAPFMPQVAGIYELEARVNTTGDSHPGNNQQSKQIEFGDFAHAMTLMSKHYLWPEFSSQGAIAGYFLLEAPDVFIPVTDQGISLPTGLGGTWDGENFWYVSPEGLADQSMVLRIDPATGTPASQQLLTLPAGHAPIDITYNWAEQQMYLTTVAQGAGGLASHFFALNPFTGAATAVFSTPNMALLSTAFDNYGNLFALQYFENASGNFLQLDPETGAVLASHSLNKTLFAHSLTENFLHFDHGTQTLYHTSTFPAFFDDAFARAIYVVNPANGQHELQGELFLERFEWARLYGYAFVPAQLPAYRVEFIVTDLAGNPMNDATITLNGEVLPMGQYIVSLLKTGSHSFTVEKQGFMTYQGNFQQGFADSQIEVAMQPSTQVMETEQSILRVFPNPASQLLTILSEEPVKRIELLDIHGRLLHAQEGQRQNRLTIDLPLLPQGIYLLRVFTSDQVKSKRIQLTGNR